MFKSMFAVLFAPPACFAIPPNAPAIRKMKSIIVIFSFPIPLAQILIFSSKFSERFCSIATISARINATTTDIM